MRAVVELLAGARRLVIFTGAGVSAESGIPTFRDALGGLWARYDPGPWPRPRPSPTIPRWSGAGTSGAA